MAEALFVYGTLHPDRAPAEIADLVRELAPIGEGTIRARLHRFREYPAIKLDSKNGSRIPGHLFLVPDDAALQQLDEYEEYYPTALDKSLFQRKPVQVRMNDGSKVQAWVYEYNRHLPKVARAGQANKPSRYKTPAGE